MISEALWPRFGAPDSEGCQDGPSVSVNGAEIAIGHRPDGYQLTVWEAGQGTAITVPDEIGERLAVLLDRAPTA